MLVVRTVSTLELRRPEGMRQRTQDTKDQSYGIAGRFANQGLHFPARIQPVTDAAPRRPEKLSVARRRSPSGLGTTGAPVRFPSPTRRTPPGSPLPREARA